MRTLRELASRIARVSKESKLQLDEDEYVKSFRHEMMDVVYAWCQGSSFAEIMKLTDAFEGNIIRCMRNLEELLRQMCTAAKAIGNDSLENKFAEGINKIKRDIVFAASLVISSSDHHIDVFHLNRVDLFFLHNSICKGHMLVYWINECNFQCERS